MRPSLWVGLMVASMAVLPATALADEGHAEGGVVVPNPLKKAVLLYLDSAGGMGLTPPDAGAVPAGTSVPGSEPVPVTWSIAATKNSAIASSPFVEFYVRVENPTVIPSGPLGGPQGAAFHVQLTVNGQPVEGAESLVNTDSSAWLPAEEPVRYRVFLPQPANATIAAGDTLGIAIRFFGANPDGLPTVSYVVGGGEQASRLQFSLQLASLAEIALPPEVGPWPVATLEGFDFHASAKGHPTARVFNLRAYQFNFEGAPVVVDNGTDVILQLYVDESLSGAGAEGHEGHGGHGGGGEVNASIPWDASTVAPLHGFSLASLKPGLGTVLFDSLVVTMRFTADKPGNYSFLCTVFCGTGHAGMLNRLEIRGPAASDAPDEASRSGAAGAPGGSVQATPGVGVLALAGAAVVVAVAARRKT